MVDLLVLTAILTGSFLLRLMVPLSRPCRTWLTCWGLYLIDVGLALVAMTSLELCWLVRGRMVLVVCRMTLARPMTLGLSIVVLVLQWETLSRLVSSTLNWLSRARSSLVECVAGVLNRLWFLNSRLVVTWTAASGACSLRDILDMNCRRRWERLLSRRTRCLRSVVTLPKDAVRCVRLLLLCMATCLARRFLENCRVIRVVDCMGVMIRWAIRRVTMLSSMIRSVVAFIMLSWIRLSAEVRVASGNRQHSLQVFMAGTAKGVFMMTFGVAWLLRQ